MGIPYMQSLFKMGLPYIWSYSGLQRQGLLPATQGLSEKFHQIFWHFDGNSTRKKSFVDNSIKTLEIFHLKEEWPHTCVSPRSQPPSANTSMETWKNSSSSSSRPYPHHQHWSSRRAATDRGGPAGDLYGFVFQVVCRTIKQIIHKVFNEVTDMRKN